MKFDEGRKKITQNKQTTIKQQQHKTTFLSFPGDEKPIPCLAVQWRAFKYSTQS